MLHFMTGIPSPFYAFKDSLAIRGSFKEINEVNNKNTAEQPKQAIIPPTWYKTPDKNVPNNRPAAFAI
jgi:hypothetical protein